MEAVHKSGARSWISEVVNLQSFLNSWVEELQGTFPHVEKSQLKEKGSLLTYEFRENMDIDREQFDEIVEECGEENLYCDLENEMLSQKQFDVPNSVELTALRLHKQDMDKRKSDTAYNNSTIQSLNYANYPTAVSSQDTNLQKYITPVKTEPEEEEIINSPDVLLTVQLFRPVSQTMLTVQKKILGTFVVDQQITVLGCQKLTDLRKYINCVSDYAVPGDFSENPDLPQANRAQFLYQSGFFFINNTFYNDMSDASNRDYSDVIMKWAKEPGRGIGPFDKKLMEETRFIDLDIQLGYPYLYMHQGNCEHLIVFNDLRLIHPEDSHKLNDYPMFHDTLPKRTAHCMICDFKTARWITYNNKRLPCDPFFFCDTCFRSFNYTVDGRKIGEFEAHPYCDRSAVI